MATAQESNKGRLIMAATMIVYGTTGVITVFIDIPAIPKAVFRMIIAALFLMTVTHASRNSIDWGLLKKHGIRLAACGALVCKAGPPCTPRTTWLRCRWARCASTPCPYS